MFHLALRSFLLSFFLSYATAQEPPKISEYRQKELLEQMRNFRLDRRLLIDDEVAWLKNYIHNVRKESGVPSNFSDPLIVLGDEEEIKRIMSNYPRSELGRNVGEPRLIEYIAPTMFVKEPARYQYQGDISYASPNSTAAALSILEISSLSWELPDSVRFWAKELHDRTCTELELFEGVRGIMRQWWKENEQAVRKRDWAAVKPGQRLELPKKPTTTPLEPTLPPTLEDSIPKPPQEMIRKELRSTPATALETSSQWLWIAGGTAAILALICGINAARPKPPSKL